MSARPRVPGKRCKMRGHILSSIVLAGACTAAGKEAPPPEAAPRKVMINHKLETLEGDSFSLEAQRGKVLLIVNVASECGYTPQYAGLQKLHETYGPKGLVVIGIPSNDFGGQEPGSHE